ncbi:hypothetical protein BS297_30385 [Rhodococcus erythropolis]|uniref:Uncharacterized protein n=1 Tax=Rhodococcus erythropolis TaxID=1833 RepID=A0A5N5DWW8_RHOER|nr:hypothetical protein BS297_30385 [Rhodococcus erythropolis]
MSRAFDATDSVSNTSQKNNGTETLSGSDLLEKYFTGDALSNQKENLTVASDATTQGIVKDLSGKVAVDSIQDIVKSTDGVHATANITKSTTMLLKSETGEWQEPATETSSSIVNLTLVQEGDGFKISTLIYEYPVGIEEGGSQYNCWGDRCTARSPQLGPDRE